MPKKRAPLHFTKPSTPVHPSLESSESNAGSKTSSGNSVNDLLQRQRQSGSKPIAMLKRPQTNIPSVPPSLNPFLNVPDVPTPRLRRGVYRRPAGPPPPTSWIDGSSDALKHNNPPGKRVQTRQSATTRDPLTNLRTLPDFHIPHERSLVYQALKALVKNWDWHLQYDRYYLATLPVRYKEILVGLIAHNSADGVRLSDLEVLFLDDTVLEDATGSDGVTHLDLSNSIGHRLNLKELKHYFIKKPCGLAEPNPENADSNVPDAWEDSPTFATLQPEPRFLFLTHLSLSRPRNPSWKQLLDLAPHLATLTHLSLAYWPTPSLTPNSKTAYRETPQGRVDYSATNYYSHSIDNDWSEAAGILKRLSKATYCLRWLDLTGCCGCISALQCEDTPIWTGAWRGLECIKVGQGWVPEYFKEANVCWVYDWLESNSDESERRASWLEILDWVKYEENIEALRGKMVRKRLAETRSITQPVGENANRALEEQDRSSAQNSAAIWWEEPSAATGAASSPSARPGNDARGSRGVIFDRGWDAWWIEDALRSVLVYQKSMMRWGRRGLRVSDPYWDNLNPSLLAGFAPASTRPGRN